MLENYLSDSGKDDLGDLPQWQKDMIDRRLKAIEDEPESIMDIAGLFYELDKEIDDLSSPFVF